MEFREYAAKEASELAARLSAEALRRQQEDARKATETLEAARAQLTAARDEQTAARKAVEADLHKVREAAESLRGELVGVKKALDKADADKKAADAATAATAAQRDEHAAARKATEADLQKLRAASEAELRSMREAAETLRGELGATKKALDKAGAEKKGADEATAAAASQRDEQAAARKAVEADLRKVREAAETLRGELATAKKAFDQAIADKKAGDEAAAAAISQSQAADVKLAAVMDLFKKSAARVKTLEQTNAEHERAIEEMNSRVASPRPAASPGAAAPILDDLLVGFQALSAATTIAELLTTLVEQTAAYFPRVALFRVKKGHLQGEHHIGFDLKTDVGKVVLPLGMDSLPARAAASGQIEQLAGGALKTNASAPFGGSPACAFAVPVAVGGDTLAIVYADDSGDDQHDSAPMADDIRDRALRALQQYTIALLMRLTSELKTLAELRKYAGSLLTEIEQMYDADLAAEKPANEIRDRLAANLDYARSIYGSRAELEGVNAASLLDDELATRIETHEGTPFARDLGAAAGYGEGQARSAAGA